MDADKLKQLLAKNAKEPKFQGNWANYDKKLRTYAAAICTNLHALEIRDGPRATLRNLVPENLRELEQKTVYIAMVNAFMDISSEIPDAKSVSSIVKSVSDLDAECGTKLYKLLFLLWEKGRNGEREGA